MKKFILFFALTVSLVLLTAETYSKKILFDELDRRDSLIRSNIKMISVEALSLMKMNDNDFTMTTQTIDYIDSLEYQNRMVDNNTKEEFLSTGKSKRTQEIDVMMQNEKFSIYTYSPNSLNSYSLKTIIPDSAVVTREGNSIRIVPADKGGILLQMLLSASDMSLKSMQFKSYFGIYNVKVIKSIKASDYLTVPDSIEVYLNEELVMTSKVKDFKIKYK
ncbi:MAG: hypothetical protein AB7T10_02440 [bacterium]